MDADSAPGWYQVPENAKAEQYWDGHAWTGDYRERVADGWYRDPDNAERERWVERGIWTEDSRYPPHDHVTRAADFGSLTKCDDCRAVISRNALLCPTCGASRSRRIEGYLLEQSHRQTQALEAFRRALIGFALFYLVGLLVAIVLASTG